MTELDQVDFPDFPVTINSRDLAILIGAEREEAYQLGLADALDVARTTVPHELAQPLSLVVGYAELLKVLIDDQAGQVFPEKAGEHANLILSGALELDSKIKLFAKNAGPDRIKNFGGYEIINIEDDFEPNHIP